MSTSTSSTPASRSTTARAGYTLRSPYALPLLQRRRLALKTAPRAFDSAGRGLCQAHDVSVEEVCAQAAMTRETFLKLAREGRASCARAQHLAKIIGCSPEVFLDGLGTGKVNVHAVSLGLSKCPSRRAHSRRGAKSRSASTMSSSEYSRRVPPAANQSPKEFSSRTQFPPAGSFAAQTNTFPISPKTRRIAKNAIATNRNQKPQKEFA